MVTREQYAIIRATLTYLHGTSAAEFVRDIFGDDHVQSYKDEKAAAWNQSPVKAIGNLDEQCFDRFVETVIQRYGDKARN